MQIPDSAILIKTPFPLSSLIPLQQRNTSNNLIHLIMIESDLWMESLQQDTRYAISCDLLSKLDY